MKQYLANRLSSRANRVVFFIVLISCFIFCLPDGLTYHSYAAKNAVDLSNPIGSPFFAAIVKNWCEFGAPLGVSLFAFNNILRWFELVNESLTTFKFYSSRRINYVVFFGTMLLGLLSVIPFYGMAIDARLNFVYVLANCIARFCMDHYAWYAIIMQILTAKYSPTRHQPKWVSFVGYGIFFIGCITATYLYTFAKDASNAVWACFGVAPTAILWGLDAKTAFMKFYETKFFFRDPNKEIYKKTVLSVGHVITSALIVLALAGATSETMMAHDASFRIGYSPLFLTSCATIAFGLLYCTGPIRLVERGMAFYQLKFGTSDDNLALRLSVKNQATEKIESMCRLANAVKKHSSSSF